LSKENGRSWFDRLTTNGACGWANWLGRCYSAGVRTDRDDFKVFTAMSFNAFNRNGQTQLIWARGDDWRRWRRS